MSLFAVAGNAGFALGPLAVTPLVLRFGLPGAGFLLVPAALIALLLWQLIVATVSLLVITIRR